MRKERHAEPHTVHWGMKIDFLLSLSFFFLHGHEMIFFFFFFSSLFSIECVYTACRRDREKEIHLSSSCFLLAVRWKKKERKTKESNKLSFYLHLFLLRRRFCCCCCYRSMYACVCQTANVLLSFFLFFFFFFFSHHRQGTK